MASREDRLAIEPRAFLACIPLFSGIRAERLSRLGAACRVLELPGHRRLYSAGQPIREAHFLASGAVKRFVLLSGKAEKVLDLIRPGQILALSEVFSTEEYGSFAETVEPSVVVAIEADILRDVAARDPVLCMRLLEAMAQSHYASEFEFLRQRSHMVTQRVLDYLLGLAGDQRSVAGQTTVRLDARKNLIAARLDIAPETLSRTLRKLADDGIIIVEGSRVHLQNAVLAMTQRARDMREQPALPYQRQERSIAAMQVSPAALVNICGRLRMLSQRMATAWWMIAFGLSANSVRIVLRKYRNQFERTLRQLERMDLAPGLNTRFDELRRVWPGYRDALMAAPPEKAAADSIFALGEQVLAAADLLATAAVEGAGTTTARLVNVAGRNRMLGARITMLFLFAPMAARSRKIGRLIESSRKEFAANMRMLVAGSVDAPEAQAQLRVDDEQWQRFLAVLDASSADTSSNEQILAVITACDELLRNVDATVKLHERLVGAVTSSASSSGSIHSS